MGARADLSEELTKNGSHCKLIVSTFISSPFRIHQAAQSEYLAPRIRFEPTPPSVNKQDLLPSAFCKQAGSAGEAHCRRIDLLFPGT